MNRISKKDFLLNTNQYIKEGIFILTLYGKDIFEIKVTTLEDKTFNKVTTFTDKVSTIDKVTTISEQKVTTSPSKAERIETAKNIGLKTANDIPAPKEVTKAFPGIKTQADYESHQARQKEKEHRMTHYGCGCKRTDESLCGKHKKR